MLNDIYLFVKQEIITIYELHMTSNKSLRFIKLIIKFKVKYSETFTRFCKLIINYWETEIKVYILEI